MAVRNAEAEWSGGLMTGSGHMKLGSGAFDGPFSFKTRMEEGGPQRSHIFYFQ